MSTAAMVTEREAILRERAAFVRGATILFLRPEIEATALTSAAHDVVEAMAPEEYPLPKVTRPRVVQDPEWPGAQWTVTDGALRMRTVNAVGGYSEWRCWTNFRDNSFSAPLPKRVALWSDLFANPTETVEDAA